MAGSASRTGSTFFLLLRDPGDAQAWRDFVARYGPKVHAWCLRWHLQAADAENVTQEVLTKLVHRIPGFAYDPARGSFRAWLKTVTRNALSDYLEAQRRAGIAGGGSVVLERLANLEAPDDLLRDLEPEFERELLEEAKARTELQVSRRDWQIFTALALEERSGADVAAELGLTAMAVFKAKSRVQKILAAELRRLDPEASPGG
jgi:RNA polymerase sigma-70 factor (ECF subfamily)